MSFQIPDKAFLSFGHKQCTNALWRYGRQIEELYNKKSTTVDQIKTTTDKELKKLKGYINILLEHETSSIKQIAEELIKDFPTSQKSLQKWLMILERENKIDLKDDDFLVTTIDSDNIKKENKKEIYLILDNLRSAFNVGSIFRTSEALGVKEIYLCGYTPTPENSKTTKSALGTDEWISWKTFENTLDCIDSLKARDIKIYAMETATNSTFINDIDVEYPCAIVLGNERFGLGESVLSRADEVLSIELYGKKNSLNVGVCAAMTLHHFISLSN